MSILLIQPAEPHRGGQIYLPGGLMNLASRMMAAGLAVTIIDLNLDSISQYKNQILSSESIGITVLGNPYIPSVIKLIRFLVLELGFDGEILIGGQGVERMEPHIFRSLFGFGSVQICSDDQLKEFLGVDLPDRYKVGIEKALASLSEERRRTYLTREFGLWIANGCSLNCDYCDGDNGIPERYRGVEGLKGEITYICGELERWGHLRLEVYLSNLDGLQTPKMLERFMKLIYSIARAYGIEVHARCLSTLVYFNRAVKRDPEILGRLKRYGLRIIAFGADGADPRVWKREHKSHNTLDGLYTALSSCLSVGLETEMLMVIGFKNDDGQAMIRSLIQSLYWASRGVIIRPYVGKPIPKKMTPDEVVPYLADPSLLLNLDYAALASLVTHPDRRQRWMVNVTYLLLIIVLTPFSRNTTFPIMPVQGNRLHRMVAQIINRFMPFDR